MTDHSILEAVNTIKDLLPTWMKFEEACPQIVADLKRIQGNVGLAAWQPDQSEKWVGELRERSKAEWASYEGMEPQIDEHEERTSKLTAAVKAVCRFARHKGVNTDPLKRVFELKEFGFYTDALLVLSHVEDELDANREKLGNEEWLPASAAVKRAEQSGHPITLKWLTRDAAKHGIQTRTRKLPGNHKVEVEWKSLAGHLLNQEQPEEESGDEAVSRRLREAQEQKRKERSLD